MNEFEDEVDPLESDRNLLNAAGALSHELKNPINRLGQEATAFIYDMREEIRQKRLSKHEIRRLDARLRAFELVVQESLSDANSLLDHMVSAAIGLSSEEVDVNFERVDLAGLIRRAQRQAVAAARSSTTATASSVRYVHNSTLEDGQLEIVADRLLLGQVIFNLLTNAIKYSDSTRREISVPIEIIPQTEFVSICVTNVGEPMSLSTRDRERTFEPFVRFSSDSVHARRGLGSL